MVAILEDKKAENVVVFDVRGKSSVTDYTVLASGASSPHLRAMDEDVRLILKQEGAACYRHSGDGASGWVVLDYVHVVVHLFLPEQRDFYGLDRLWNEDGDRGAQPDA